MGRLNDMVAIDTNMLLAIGQFNVDVFEEIKGITGNAKIVVPNVIVMRNVIVIKKIINFLYCKYNMV